MTLAEESAGAEDASGAGAAGRRGDGADGSSENELATADGEGGGAGSSELNTTGTGTSTTSVNPLADSSGDMTKDIEDNSPTGVTADNPAAEPGSSVRAGSEGEGPGEGPGADDGPAFDITDVLPDIKLSRNQKKHLHALLRFSIGFGALILAGWIFYYIIRDTDDIAVEAGKTAAMAGSTKSTATQPNYVENGQGANFRTEAGTSSTSLVSKSSAPVGKVGAVEVGR